MPSLVALALGGPPFVDALRAVWDAGDAALPLDPRLPAARRDELVAAFRPGAVVEAGRERRSLPGGEPVEDGDALVVATSGTTGEPKGVVLTGEAVAAAAWATSRRLGVDPAADRWLACLPLAHVGGLGVVTRSLVTGTPVVVHEGFDAAAVEAAARAGVTLISLVPTALGRVDAGLFRRVLLGGAAPLGPVPPNVTVTYGLTETGGGVVYDGVPLDGVDVRVVGGEVQVRGPMLLRAYRDGRDPRSPDGWLATGDGGEVGADGRLVVHGRLAEVVVTGGEKVWPRPVEDVLRRHPAVADVAVAGRPDPEWGQRVVAWVVAAPGAEAPAVGELRAFARDHLAPWELPREVVPVGELPRGMGGKVARARLP